MYFINYKSLIDDHKSGKFSDLDIIPYLVGYYLLNSISNLNYKRGGPVPQTLDSLVIIFAIIVMTIVFTIIIYAVLKSYWKANGGSTSKNLVPRIISLGWVFSFRALVVIAPLIGLFAASIAAFSLETWLIAILGFILLALVLAMIFYIFTGVRGSLQDISGTSDNF
jgi:hypothetical protein